MKNTYFNKRWAGLGFEAGWFPGENLVLFSLDVGEVGDVGVFLFSIKVLKLVLTVWVDR